MPGSSTCSSPTATEARLREAAGAPDLALVRALFVAYRRWLGVSLCFQNFDEELATLPGAYAPPRGRLLLAGPPGDAFGCAALRPLDAATGEVKRLYVQPRARGQGWGRRLADAIVAGARAAGYRALKLDTLATMQEAQALYASLGFRRCDPYYANPHPGTIYMHLDLAAAAETR